MVMPSRCVSCAGTRSSSVFSSGEMVGARLVSRPLVQALPICVGGQPAFDQFTAIERPCKQISSSSPFSAACQLRHSADFAPVNAHLFPGSGRLLSPTDLSTASSHL